VSSIHGFRMQLFMLVSGYLRMMSYRKRGLNSLMKQRFLRLYSLTWPFHCHSSLRNRFLMGDQNFAGQKSNQSADPKPPKAW
jgi:hypothetical protein